MVEEEYMIEELDVMSVLERGGSLMEMIIDHGRLIFNGRCYIFSMTYGPRDGRPQANPAQPRRLFDTVLGVHAHKPSS